MNPEMERIIVALQARQPLPDDIAKNIIAALFTFEKFGESKAVCVALGCERRAGERLGITKSNIELRNHYLHRAILMLGGITFANCRKLADEITRWQTVTRKNQNRHDYELTKFQNMIKNAENYHKLPSTAEGILAALTK